MKLIIDISKDDYIKVQDGRASVVMMRDAIRNGAPLKQEPCEDCISREDALMALTGEWTELTDEIIYRFIKRIKSLPPVTPTEKVGRWIGIDEEPHEDWECDRCGHIEYANEDLPDKYHFCPNCGAKMK